MITVEDIMQQKKVVDTLQAEVDKITEIMAEYENGGYDLQGIRVFSRLHISMDLNKDLLPINELLEMYIHRVQHRLDDAAQRLQHLVDQFREDDRNKNT